MQVITHALTRKISRALSRCELTHLERATFDLRARLPSSTENYVAQLRLAGAEVEILPEEPDLADSTFVEDPAVILDELAILGRLGALSREPETALLRQTILSRRRVVRTIESPGRLEGGDVLRIEKEIFVGGSSRTNDSGIAQLRRFTAPFGYRVHEVAVTGCLHLKTAVTSPAPGVILANPDWIDVAPFKSYEIVAVPRSEPWGGNTLAINGRLLVSSASPRTAELLARRGYR